MPYVDPDEFRMSLGDHLDDLRRRLIYGLAGPLVASAVMLYFGKDIVSYLCRPLLVALDTQGLPAQVINPSVTSAFAMYMKVSFIFGIIIGIPWMLFQLWQFIAPGLYPKERKFVTKLIPGSIILTVTGVAFMFYCLLPLMLWFLIQFSLGFNMPDLHPNAIEKITLPSDTGHATTKDVPLAQLPVLTQDPDHPKLGQAWIIVPQNQLRIFAGDSTFVINMRSQQFMTPLIQLETYISFVMGMALAFAITFQLPLVLLAITYIGIVTPQQLAKARPYLIVIILFVSAVLTPPDVLSQMGLAIPMYLLFEFGVLLSRRAYRKRLANLAAMESDDDQA